LLTGAAARQKRSVQRSGGEWLSLVVALFDPLITVQSHLTGGSNPLGRKGIMAVYHNAKMGFSRFIENVHRILSRWVVRAALLALGIGAAYPQPFAHSFL
jgi:hypothetical protein